MISQEDCQVVMEKFIKSAAKTPWTPRSILMSEAFAVCAAINKYGITDFIESGVFDGRSTEIWCRFDPSISVTAIDVVRRHTAIEKLKSFPNFLDFLEGAGSSKIPSLIEAASGKVGIFLDGPKENKAVDLAKIYLENPKVQFVAIHDMHRIHKDRLKECRKYMENQFNNLFFTDFLWFVKSYGFLDENEYGFDPEGNSKWCPGGRTIGFSDDIAYDFGSYGPTVGIAFKDHY